MPILLPLHTVDEVILHTYIWYLDLEILTRFLYNIPQNLAENEANGKNAATTMFVNVKEEIISPNMSVKWTIYPSFSNI